MSRRIDTWTCAGIAVTATAAASASAGTQHQLAVAAGWGSVIAWMLPVCVDALAAVAARVWLDSTAGDTERRYARTVALSAVAVSLSLNSAGHAVAAGLLAVSVPLLVAVAAIPAASLAAIMHLTAMRTMPRAKRRQRRSDQATSTDSSTATANTGSASPTRARANTVSGTGANKTRDTASDGNVTPMRPGATYAERARPHWDHERAQGRTPSGAELARVAGCSPSRGRQIRQEFLDPDTADQNKEEGAS